MPPQPNNGNMEPTLTMDCRQLIPEQNGIQMPPTRQTDSPDTPRSIPLTIITQHNQ
jgi:hypothetical protein